MTYFEALIAFIFKRQLLPNLVYDSPWLIFISSAAIFGFLFILLHYMTIRLFGFKIFKIRDQAHFIEVIIFWTLASAIVSMIGYSIGAIGDTVFSCAAVGASWMYILSDMLKRFREPNEKQN